MKKKEQGFYRGFIGIKPRGGEKAVETVNTF